MCYDEGHPGANPVSELSVRPGASRSVSAPRQYNGAIASSVLFPQIIGVNPSAPPKLLRGPAQPCLLDKPDRRTEGAQARTQRSEGICPGLISQVSGRARGRNPGLKAPIMGSIHLPLQGLYPGLRKGSHNLRTTPAP